MRLLLILFIALLAGCTPSYLAKKSFQDNDFQRSIQLCKMWIVADSSNADAWILLARAFYRTGIVDSALIAYERAFAVPAVKKYPSEEYYELLIADADQRLPENAAYALDQYRKAVQLDGQRPLAFQKLGDYNFEKKDFIQARSFYSQALLAAENRRPLEQRIVQIDSIEAAALKEIQLGKKMLSEGNFQNARDHFLIAASINPQEKEAAYGNATAEGLRLYQRGSINALWDAIQAFGRASVLFPQRAEPHYRLGLAYHKKNKDEYQNAIDELERAIALEPDGEFGIMAQKELASLKARKQKMEQFWGK
ncbi:MAG: hypothetical protein EHM72_07105 [Calditrichaeota bacterium]|nr:MAG: hypothetical protein EHM72_07105 [Calditrichota bacterium]